MRKETVWYKWDEIIKPSPDLRRKHTHHLQRALLPRALGGGERLLVERVLGARVD